MNREQELTYLIKKYSTEYYSGQALVTDEYFDSLVDELKEINPESEVLTTGWGYTPSRKTPHLFNLHIGSLGKVKSVDSLKDWFKDTTRVSAKLDGLSVVSYYINGTRVQAITRGDGSVGKDVTHHMKMISPETESISVNGHPLTGAIRGEVVLPNSVWESKYLSQKEDNPSLNQRNLASGYINRDSITQEIADDLRYVVYKCIYNEDKKYSSVYEIDQELLVNPGIIYVPYVSHIQLSDESFREIFDKFTSIYPCDGLVLSNYRDNAYDEVAYKFQAESKIVTVKDVQYNATRTGKMMPLIIYEPIELSGAICQRCTGFNAAFIRDNKINVGSVIEVCRSNEVIPYIMRVVTPSEEGKLPDKCPNCGNEDLVWSGDDLVCENENESQLSYHFITACAPVDGAGWKLYSKIVESLGLDSLQNLCNFLFNLNYFGVEDCIEYLEDHSDISGGVTWNKVKEILNKLLEPVDEVKFLSALNIKGISWNTAETIISQYEDFISDVKCDTINPNKLYSIKGIGYKTVDTLCKFRYRIERLASVVELKRHEKSESSESLFKVAITGALSMKRSDFDAKLKSYGISQSGNFKEIKYLITNKPNSTSSKMKKAIENGVEIISEEEFVNKYFN